MIKTAKVMLPLWKDRPQILARLLNPAFCAKIIYECCKGYEEETKKGLPFAVAFFILPIILHKQTRNLIPLKSKALHVWLDQNNEIKIDLAKRIRGFNPFTKESVMFLIAAGTVTMEEDGSIKTKKLGTAFSTEEDNTEVLDCFKKAKAFGKILSKSGNVFTIYSIIGVKP